MNKLETTLISLAREKLAAVLAFHDAQQAGTATEEDFHEFSSNHGALFAFLMLSHFDSGLSSDASEVLGSLEKEYTDTLPSTPERSQSTVPVEDNFLIAVKGVFAISQG